MIYFNVICSVCTRIFTFTMPTPAQRHMCYVHTVYLYYTYCEYKYGLFVLYILCCVSVWQCKWKILIYVLYLTPK